MQPFLLKKIEQLAKTLQERQRMIATAESCTGGQIASSLTTLAGSSAWFERGFITYSNDAKEEQLAVPVATLTEYGAVSRSTAIAMAEGALKYSHAQISLAVTGIAGPSGGTEDKPAGTVWIAWSHHHAQSLAKCYHYKGQRMQIRNQATLDAIQGCLELL